MTSTTKLGVICDKFLETCWLAALVLSPFYMNIYTHRMFEPDKACVIRSLALLMLVFYLVKILEIKAIKPTPLSTSKSLPVRQAGSSLPVVASAPAGGFWHFTKSPIFIPFLLFVSAYVTSVIFSATSHNSIWGGYDRLQGLYTNASFWVIFILTALNLKTKEQIERLVGVVIFTSLPIVAYSYIQRFRLDPVPWSGIDPSGRVSATAGNPIFLAAYIVIAIPLTLSRFVRSLRGELSPSIFKAIFYGSALCLLFSVVFLAKSRGPLMGMLISIVMFTFIYAFAYRKKKLLIIIIAAILMGVTFLGIFNLPHLIPLTKWPSSLQTAWEKTFGKLIKNEFFAPLGRFGEFKSGTSGRTRMILWNGVLKLITDKDVPYRFFIGYGPESLSTVYYKNYTMELASLEGHNVHADRSHNHYLDVWVMHGLVGLIAYLLLIFSIIYTGLKVILKSNEKIIMLGLLTAVIAHLVEIAVGIAIVATYTHFWVLVAGIYATYKLRLQEPSPVEATRRVVPPLKPEAPDHFNFGFYLLLGYLVLTIVIALILFVFTWPAGQVINQEIKFARDSLINFFYIWLIAGFILGMVAWRPYLFWTYIIQTLTLIVILVRRYWPDDTTNTDILIIYSWWWILAGIIIGVASIKREIKPVKFWHFSNFLLGLVLLVIIVFIIAESNLAMLRADGFYKFCFSYDTSAEQFNARGEKEAAYQTRLACARYFQNALRYAPGERAYLNGSGRNFLELSKMITERIRTGIIKDPPKNKLNELPTIKELIEMNWHRLRDFSVRDFLICSASCIQKAYELDPNNFERIIAMIRIYRYWGDLDRDISKYEKGLALCAQARKASPLNDKTGEEERELNMRISALRPPR